MRIVDLTRPIREGMQVYPGDPEPTAEQTTTLAEEGFELHRLVLGSQTGTHLDAPSHTLAGGGHSDSVQLSRLIGRGVVIDVRRDEAREGGLISPGPWVEDLEPGDIVLFRADWDRFDDTERAWQHPGLNPDLAVAIVARGVAAIGLDFASVDRHGTDLLAHRILAAGGVPVIENLTGLARVDWIDPLIIILPLAWPGLDGVPVRAVACDLPPPRPESDPAD